MTTQQVTDTGTQCAVHDKTPGSEQQRISLIVGPTFTVDKVFQYITIQYGYDSFDLILQPFGKGDLVYLNDCRSNLLYDVSGFNRTKNNLILLPSGEWDGNTKKRYDFALPTLKCNTSTTVTTTTTTSAINTTENRNRISTNNVTTMNAIYIDGGISLSSLPADITDITSSDFVNNLATDSFNLSPTSEPEQLSDDDLALGASASPAEAEPSDRDLLSLIQQAADTTEKTYGVSSNYGLYGDNDLSIYLDPNENANNEQNKVDDAYTMDSNYSALPSISSTTAVTYGNGFVGLVNQAMTCYLNSLLQALYMTPEFRNALYRWVCDYDNEAKNIPYQLQKLFLNLQTSKKSAIETTDLTRSFGWDSTEAWQQHDIQELCRVMFDALEHKFRNTKQANLISNLYEGKMIDYVKCLECNTEKTRADTFLDIPLPVRPFGSNVAYGSIEEAMRGFVQPETLDGNNQYFCEKCNKKCDAHKGLKFSNFPYVLTLHLKRFDFDYQTMHRIKLNDRVTYPQTLNLSTFINSTDAETFANLQANNVANAAATTTQQTGSTNVDDCSTTDSGSAMEEDCSSGIATTASSSQHENDMNFDDEGIDILSSSNGGIKRTKSDSNSYLYELFAIMIHSGSASGGHYYAYIKDFENNEWYCFNDQSVTSITQEDIQKSFGGGPTKAYYSSVYSSSTNAYMLMYRQMDPRRNERIMKVVDFPEHIQQLLNKIREDDNTRNSRLNISDLAIPELYKPRVYFYNPDLRKLKSNRVLPPSYDVNLILESAYCSQMHIIEQFAPISRCRIVGFDQSSEEIIQSFENAGPNIIHDLRKTIDGQLDFLLEYCADGQEFEIYEPGGATWYVYMVNLATMEMDGPFLVYSSAHECNNVLRRSIAIRLHVNEKEMLLATLPAKKAFVAYDPNPTKDAEDHLQAVAKVQFRHLTYLYLHVPDLDPKNLETRSIPAFETQKPAIEVSSDVVDAVLLNSAAQSLTPTVGDTSYNSGLSTTESLHRESPIPSNSFTPVGGTAAAGHESNSEDSSLSDGDRTLVESIQNRGGGDSQISSNSHSPQLSSPEEEAAHESYNRITAFINNPSHQSEGDAYTYSNGQAPLFFHAIKCNDIDFTSSSKYYTENSEELANKPTHAYKIIYDSLMLMANFKKNVESLINVPANYFKLHRKHDNGEPIGLTHSLVSLAEGEVLIVKLGKVLQPDEYKAKIYFMRLSELDNETGKLPFICEWVYNATMKVLDAKKDLIAKLHRIDAHYKSLTVENCRIWLKGGRNPIKIMADDEPLVTDLRSTASSEFLIQECENGVNPKVGDDSLTIFVRRWHPDKLQLDPFQEITLERESEIRTVISQITDIPEERIAYCKLNSCFPSTNISLLSINGSMSWFSIPATIDKYPLTTTTNANVYLFKDVSKAPKELSNEERRELNAKEKSRLDRLGCITTFNYSPRRERALKIYLDSPQSTKTTNTPPPPTSDSNVCKILFND